MKNKIITILIIIISIECYQKMDYYSHKKIINNVFAKNAVNKYDYIGYIEIDRIDIKREIKKYSEQNLINSVTLYEGDNLDENHVVLAGHAIKNIFGNLKYIRQNDVIKIITFENKYEYLVTDIYAVNKKDYKAIDSGDLVLITCKDFNNRYIIKAKKIGI